MTRGSGIIGGITSLRRTLACRVFALLFIVLIVSPFTAPFATFELIAITDVAEGGDEPVKGSIDVIMNSVVIAALPEPAVAVACDEAAAADIRPPSVLQTILRI